MGIGGTAMGALAGMLVDAGHTVTGSDGGIVYPPMSDYLAGLGIDPMVGFEAHNLDHRPDLVVVGNVVRRDYDEARALLASSLPYTSFPSLLGARFLDGSRNIVVSGTHGKTTTTSITAWLLDAAGRAPGFLIGGVAANFDRTARAGDGRFFVIEGDEYDTAFFDKGPKFLHYRPTTAILTSVEFDHADIYRDLAHCQESFRKLMAILPSDGCVVARWDHDSVAEVAREASCELRRYGPGQDWDGRIEGVDTRTGMMSFTVLHEGRRFGTFETSLVGEHNLYNQVAAVAALSREGLGEEELAAGFRTFKGIRRRQEISAEVDEVTIIDDFAHHPTAVELTLEALRLRFGGRRLWAIFEPRSNSSRRNIFQEAYAESFGAADIVVISPPRNLDRIPEGERFDANAVVEHIRRKGRQAHVWGHGLDGTLPDPAQSADLIARQVAGNVLPGDVVAVLSNGGFGGIHGRLREQIAARAVLHRQG
jgi:UDP-N-acetylmuramate: L-alanyl-gamma-D-glutamyl-meso-diaminopimelate ligase